MKRNKLIVGIGLLLIGVFALYGFASAEMTCVTTWGSYGTGQGEFDYPRGIAVAPDSGQVYVADTYNNRVQIFDSVGNPVYPYVLGGSFYQPYDIAVDPADGNVYVTDYQNKRIQKFTSAGAYLAEWSVDPSTCPHGITVDSVSGYVFVANDCAPDSIMIFDVNGDPQSLEFNDLSSWTYFEARDIASDSQGNFYVVDGGGTHFIHMFDRTGKHCTSWGEATEHHFNDPWYIAVDSEDYVYVTNVGTGIGAKRVQKFSVNKTDIPPTLNLVADWYGCDTELFSCPTGIAGDLNGTVYVADSVNNLIHMFCGPVALIQGLISDVVSLNLKQGLETSLDTKLDNALAALDAANADKREDAINKLEAFKNAVEAQRDKEIDSGNADLLIAAADAIIALLQL